MIDFTATKDLLSKFTVTGAQKAHIDRLIFELSIFEKDIVRLNKKIADDSGLIEALTTESTELKTQNGELKMKLYDLSQENQKSESLNQECEKILKFYFDHTETSRDHASRSLGIPLSDVTHHVGTLIKVGFLQHSRAAMSNRRPAFQKILHPGSEYAMTNLREQDAGDRRPSL